MIKGAQAVRGELSELDKQLSDCFLAEDSIMARCGSDVRNVLQANQCLIKYTEILKKVTFLSFDVKEWVIENDLLVHRLKEDDSKATVQEVLDNFKSLLEKVQGLPPESSFICYELAIAYNISHLLLRGHSNVHVGGCHKSAAILHKSLLRAFEAFKIDSCHQQTAEDVSDIFSTSNIDCVLEQLLPSLFKAFIDSNIGCAPLVLSCCLLAFLWLLDEHVNQVKVVKLLLLMQDHLNKLKESAKSDPTEEVPAGRCPVYLFSLEYIPSITSCIVTSSTADLTDTQNLFSVVTSLLAFSHYANKDYDKVLKTLDDRVENQEIGFNDLYLKGYVFYLRNEVDKALTCFQQCVNISQSRDKAAALIMLGCCCTIKGKLHTAIAKFREAMELDFQQLEALFNVCLQYRKLGNFVAEIQCLKLLKQAIQSSVDSERCYNVAVIPSDLGGVHNNSKLELTIPPRFTLAKGMPRTRITTELVTYMLAKRCADLGRFEEAANSYLELLANIVEMRSASFSHATNLASPSELYHQCGITLLKAGRYQDTVTVCDKVLTTADGVQRTEKGNKDDQSVNSSAARKRMRSMEDGITNRTDEETVSCDMLMLKSEALIHLHQPLEALQSLNRVLKTVEGVQLSNHCSTHEGTDTPEQQQRKRRRIDLNDGTLSMEEKQSFEPNKLVKLKARAYNQKATILEDLGQTHDALQQLHLSLECFPENPGTVYKHTQLLLKQGSEKEAATNWLRFRGIQRRHKGDLDSVKKLLRSSIVKFLDSDEVTLEQVQAVDEAVLELCTKTPDDFFYFVTSVL